MAHEPAKDKPIQTIDRKNPELYTLQYHFTRMKLFVSSNVEITPVQLQAPSLKFGKVCFRISFRHFHYLRIYYDLKIICISYKSYYLKL